MLSIIIPTLGNRIIEIERLLESLEKQSSPDFEIILVIQENHAAIEKIAGNYELNIKICNIFRKGLSHARNEGIKLINKEATLVTFSDDDCWYPPNTVAIVLDNFRKFNCSICYQIFDPTINEPYKAYPTHEKEKLSLRESLKVSSIEIFVPKLIIDAGLRFNEGFGLGTPYPSGEENIFLFDVIRQGYTIRYFPVSVVFHLKPVWANKEYIFKGKGALFAKLYDRYTAKLLIIIYAARKHKHSSNIFSDLTKMFKETLS